jgi:hypothetical protein
MNVGIARYQLQRQTCFLARRLTTLRNSPRSISSLLVNREGSLLAATSTGTSTSPRFELFRQTTIRSLAGGKRNPEHSKKNNNSNSNSNNHSHSNKNKGGGGGGGNKITVIPVYGPEDDALSNYDKEDVLKIDAPKSIDQFFQSLNQELGTEDDGVMKMYNSSTGEWEAVLELEQIQREHKAANKVFVAQDYGDDDDDDDYDFGDEDEDHMGSREMKLKIMDLVNELKAEGWNLKEEGLLLEKTDGLTSTTKDIVIQKAAEDILLQDILLNRVGSLDHIAQCLQYKFVWNPPETDEEENEEEET